MIEVGLAQLAGPFLLTPKAAKIRFSFMVMKRQSVTKEQGRAFVVLPAEQKSYDEIVDLFARGASSAEVLAFRPSQETQERVRELLERNAAAELTEEEAVELERFGELEHLMQLVKARAQEYLKAKT